jgi:hypothetical protein
VARERCEFGIADCVGLQCHLQREVEHRSLPWCDLSLAVVDRDLISEEGILGPDAQKRAVRNHAVVTLVGLLFATTIISRSALLSPPAFSISAS